MTEVVTQQSTPHKKASKKWPSLKPLKRLFIIIAAAMCLVILAALAVIGIRGWHARQAAAAAQSFVQSVKDNKLDEAYGLFTDSYKQRISRDDFGHAAATPAFAKLLASPSHKTQRIQLLQKDNIANVYITFDSGNATSTAKLNLQKQNGQWHINSFSLLE